MELEKRKNFIINLLYWAALMMLIYLLFKYLLGIIMPFLLALLFSSVLRPVSSLLVDKLHFRYKPAAALVTLLFFGIIGFLFAFIGVRAAAVVAELLGMLPALYQDTIAPGIVNLLDMAEDLAATFGVSIVGTLNDMGPTIIDSFGNAVSAVSGAAGTWAASFVVKMPGFLVSFIVMIIATFFISVDYDRIIAFIMRRLPERARKITLDIKNSFVRVLLRYGRSYAIIMGVTFVEITIGMLILGHKNAPVIGIIVATLDIFPILGTGMILGPWAVFGLIQGDFLHAAGLLILYLVVTVIRQIMEPRIVGSHVGLHPIVTLSAMFIGGNLFGVTGFFGFPIMIAILRSLTEDGTITLFNKRPPDDVPPDNGEEEWSPGAG